MNQPPAKPYPLRLRKDLNDEIMATVEATKLPKPDAMREALWLGLPILKKKMNKERK